MTGGARLAARLWWAEARRGTALTAGSVVAVTLGGLFLHNPGDWVGRWYALMEKVRADAPFLLAIVAMFAAWQAGRDHRRGTYEMLTHAARPRWQSVLFIWGVGTAGSIVGIALAYGVLAALFVVPFASYTGTGWIAPLLVCVPALAAATALGTAVGILLRWRVIAPLTGIGVYVGSSSLQYAGRRGWLVPGVWSGQGASRPPGAITGLQFGWFVALAALFLLLSLSTWRRRLTAVVLPAVVAGVVGALLVGSPDPSGDRGATVTDAAASRPVCQQHSGIKVCLSQENAFLLPSLGVSVAARLTRISSLPGGPRVAIDYDTGLDTTRRPGRTFFETGYDVDLHGTEDAAAVGDLLFYDPLTPQCMSDSPVVDQISTAAQAWAQSEDALEAYQLPDPEGTRILQQLNSLSPELQREWMTRYLALVPTCDTQLAARLKQPSDVAGWR